MKLRIAGSSLRLRVSPSDLARLMQSGRIEETIRFAADANARLIYALELSEAQSEISIRHQAQGVTVVLPGATAREWADGESVGIYGAVDAAGQKLELMVEKDFACLDGSDRDNIDTFPNPQKEAAC
jgi:ribosome-associated translation inhibitor RaiA